jgi:hypothetical protein
MFGGRKASKLPVSKRSAGHKNNQFVFKEFERFATSSGFIIQEAPLQIYGAALAFCPQARIDRGIDRGIARGLARGSSFS